MLLDPLEGCPVILLADILDQSVLRGMQDLLDSLRALSTNGKVFSNIQESVRFKERFRRIERTRQSRVRKPELDDEGLKESKTTYLVILGFGVG